MVTISYTLTGRLVATNTAARPRPSAADIARVLRMLAAMGVKA